MNRPALYTKTRQILFDAYYNDTLTLGYCSACAIGNIIASNMGISIIKNRCGYPEWTGPVMPTWQSVFYTTTTFSGKKQISQPLAMDLPNVAQQINSTGYTWEELARIEHAFETAPVGDSDEDAMFNAFVAALEALDRIHQIETNSSTLKRRICQKQ